MSSVLSGLDVLVRKERALLRGRRLGLLCHQASVTRDLTHASDAVARLRGTRLAALFAPEHGIAGAAQDHVSVRSTKDPATGLPVWSLYERRLAPDEAMLKGIDTLVVDLQDVGSRYYTFLWTTILCMRQCAKMEIPVVVLDRPNPLGGLAMEGNVPDPRFASFVGLHPLPVRHGMTIGELADVPERATRHRLRSDCRADGRMAPRHALGGHGAAVGRTVAQHADHRHRARVPRRLPDRGHQPLGGPRHHAPVRADRRAVPRRAAACCRPRAAGPARRDLSRGRVPAGIPQASRPHLPGRAAPRHRCRALSALRHVPRVDHRGAPAVPAASAGAARRTSSSGRSFRSTCSPAETRSAAPSRPGSRWIVSSDRGDWTWPASRGTGDPTSSTGDDARGAGRPPAGLRSARAGSDGRRRPPLRGHEGRRHHAVSPKFRDARAPRAPDREVSRARSAAGCWSRRTTRAGGSSCSAGP